MPRRRAKATRGRPDRAPGAFIGLGGYYLLTGRRAASMKEFVVEGKLSHDDAAPPKA
jgi:hypothetical protein